MESSNVIFRFTLSLLLLIITGCSGDSLVNSEKQTADPVVEQIPFLYVKRIRMEEQAESPNLADITAFRPGASLFLKTDFSNTTAPINISDSAFFQPEDTILPYDVKDIETSYDGEFAIFSMRAPELEDVDENEQPKWNIWQYEFATKALTRIISSDLQAEQGHDTAPYYLPDGRIVFSSTRQTGNKAILLDEGKPQYQALDDAMSRKASVLHVMNRDGTNIKQISYGQSHDRDPIVLTSGKILFSRWEQRGRNSGMNLYQIDSDGKQLELVYGRHSHAQNDIEVQFIQPREIADGKILLGVRPVEQDILSTDFVIIDTHAYIDNEQPIDIQSGLQGPAQVTALFAASPLDGELSLNGKFNLAYPLNDESGRIIMGWDQCRVLNPENTEQILPCDQVLLDETDILSAPSLFGLWVFDPVKQTQRPLVLPEENAILTEVATFEKKPFPLETQIPSDPELENTEQGILHIRSVYDFAGEDLAQPDLTSVSNSALTARNDRQAHFIRFVKPVSIPDRDDHNFNRAAFGRSRGKLMRDILGYAPVELDGSVHVVLPANMAFGLEVLDIQGRRIFGLHDSWLQLAPGEKRTCNGCHTANSVVPHGLVDKGIPALNSGAQTEGPFVGSTPNISAQVNETMAEAKSRVLGQTKLSSDLNYSDIWTDTSVLPAEESSFLSYNDLETQKPISENCAQNWQNHCRVTINFPVHIQPLFDLSRPILDQDNIEVANNRCTGCHTNMDEEDVIQVPAAQLDLRNQASTDNTFYTTAYRDLFFNDNEQEIIDDILQDRLLPVLDSDGNPVFETDENGDLILDADGNPIQVFQSVNVSPSLSVNGANASTRFMSLFAGEGTHFNRLSPVELKLVSEWLDLGAQYYNNPFIVPAN